VTDTKAGSCWQRTFFAIWGGLALSRIGSTIAQFALVWWLTDLTGSAAVLASASALALVPQIVLGPVAGTYVDRWDRRITIIVSDGVMALLALALAWLFWAGRLEIWHVYVIMIARALGDIFHYPATQAATVMLVPGDQLARVHGLNQVLGGSIGVLGPPLGALALALLPLYGVMAIDVVTAAMAIVPLLFVRIPQPERHLAQGASAVLQDMRAGFRYLWGLPGIVAVIALAVVLNFASAPIGTMMPLYVRNEFGGGAPELGLVEAAYGAGMIAGGAALSLWGHRVKSRVVVGFGGLALSGLACVGAALAPTAAVWALAACWLAMAAFNSIGNGTFMALLQGSIAPDMQGRANSALSSLVMLAIPLGLAISAPVVVWLGLRFLYLFSGVICAAGCLWAMRSKSIRALDGLTARAAAAQEATGIPVEEWALPQA
jgi:DHA3 family macrolide efflux protein-like MFS transporter